MFHTFFYQPIFNILVFIYNVLPIEDLGVSIVLLTVLIKGVLYPLSSKSIKSQKELADLQPKINELKEQYKNDREQMGRAMIELYKQHNINPLSSCLPLLIQLPFFYAIFKVFNTITKPDSFSLLYPFVAQPGNLQTNFLGMINLSNPSLILAVLAGLSQFVQARMLSSKRTPVKGAESRDEDFTAILNKQMIYMMPFLTVVIGMKFAGGLALYWLVTNLLTILQQLLVFKKAKA